MKYLLLFILSVASGINTFGQKMSVVQASKLSRVTGEALAGNALNISSHRATAAGDTAYMAHIALSDTMSLYRITDDSGFVYGMNAYNDKSFAERYDFSGSDSTIRVIGVIARFGGKVSPSSTRSVDFKAWLPAPKSVSVRNTLYNSGMPETVIATKTVAFGDLGVSASDTVDDSSKLHFFNYATSPLSQSFFVGYAVTYSWGVAMAGDTIGLYTNKDGERTAPTYTVVSDLDTTINNVNVTQYSNNVWHDNAVDNFALSTNLFVFPVVTVGAYVTSAQSISRNGLSFFGSYPNPATGSSNIKIGLAKDADVSIELMDMSSKVVRTISSTGLKAGEHIIPLSTAGLPAGDYIYLIRTGTGEGIASKLTIAE